MQKQNIVKLLWLAGLLLMQSAHAKKEGELEAGMVNPGYVEQPQWFKQSFLDLNEDIAEASENGKRLMIYFYQDGCPYCKKLLQDNFGQRDIAEKTRNNFDVVSLNIWGDRDVTLGDTTTTEKDFAERLKVMYTPTLIFFNEEGKAVLRANGYYPPQKFDAALDYVLQRKDKTQSFRAYLASAGARQTEGKLHTDVATLQSPYDFSKRSDKHRLVMFEQKQCKECDELHLDILQRDESKQQLKKFDVAVLDMWSEDKLIRPDGRKVAVKDWARELNIQYAPSLVYFDPQGNEVFRSDGYLRSFHVQSVMDYVSSEAYKTQPNFQRYIDNRAHELREQGIEVDLMN